jgi:fructose-1,6-bisphosphatase
MYIDQKSEKEKRMNTSKVQITNEDQIKKLQLIGSLWERENMKRVYFNNLEDIYGLETQWSNSDNVSSAKLDGEAISNNQARQICWRLGSGKFWFDMNDGFFHGNGLDDNDFVILVNHIKKQIRTA